MTAPLSGSCDRAGASGSAVLSVHTEGALAVTVAGGASTPPWPVSVEVARLEHVAATGGARAEPAGTAAKAATVVAGAALAQRHVAALKERVAAEASDGGVHDADTFHRAADAVVERTLDTLRSGGASAAAVADAGRQLSAAVRDTSTTIAVSGNDTAAVLEGIDAFVQRAGQLLDQAAARLTTAIERVAHATTTSTQQHAAAEAYGIWFHNDGLFRSVGGFAVSFGDACAVVGKAFDDEHDREGRGARHLGTWSGYGLHLA